MAQRLGILISRAPVSAFTSTNGAAISRVRENAFPLSHTPTNCTAPDEVLHQCRGTTKKGSRCKRFLKGKSFCHDHNAHLLVAEPIPAAEAPLPMNDETATPTNSSAPNEILHQCRGTTKKGSRCKRFLRGKFFCHDHNVHPPVTEPISTAEAPLTMNDITAKIPNLLRSGYYRCAGMSTIDSRCERRIKGEAYCHFHATQLLYYVRRDKSIVTRTIMQVKAHKGPIDDNLAEIREYLLTQGLWLRMQVDNFENLLRNITKGPLRALERDQGVYTEAPQSDHTYVCRGRTKVGRSCRNKTVGKFYCRYHDPLRIMAGDVEIAFAAV